MTVPSGTDNFGGFIRAPASRAFARPAGLLALTRDSNSCRALSVCESRCLPLVTGGGLGDWGLGVSSELCNSLRRC